MFDIILSHQAEKFYNDVNDKLASKFNIAFDEISVQPYYGNNIKKLKGDLDGLYRYRSGDYRIVYSIEDKIKIVSVNWIGKRKDAY